MPTIQPPTARLPNIAKIAFTSTTQLFESLQYLHSLYRPQVRGSRRRRRDRDENLCRPAPDDGDDDDDQRVRSDVFERAYAIRWLTTLVVQLAARQEPSSLLTATPAPGPTIDTGIQPSSSSDLPIDDTDTLTQQAASLLAACAGVAAAGRLHRRFSFESPALASKAEGGIHHSRTTVHVELVDIPLDNHNYASVGAQTWGGACVLAEMIAERPDRFGLGLSLTGARSRPSVGCDTDLRTHPLRVLELGAGTGLVGLTVGKLLQALFPCKNPNPTLHPRATIVLTDFYPAVLANLQSNIDANFPIVPVVGNSTDHPVILVHCHPLDWSSFSPTTEMAPVPDIFSTPFDLVFGADIIYEAQHAVWIRDCLTSLLSYPDDSNKDPVFHLVIPLRPTHTLESSTVEEVFGPKDHVSEGSQRKLAILSKETIVCQAYGVERSRTDDDVDYVYYRIGWTQ